MYVPRRSLKRHGVASNLRRQPVDVCKLRICALLLRCPGCICTPDSLHLDLGSLDHRREIDTSPRPRSVGHDIYQCGYLAAIAKSRTSPQ